MRPTLVDSDDEKVITKSRSHSSYPRIWREPNGAMVIDCSKPKTGYAYFAHDRKRALYALERKIRKNIKDIQAFPSMGASNILQSPANSPRK